MLRDNGWGWGEIKFKKKRESKGFLFCISKYTVGGAGRYMDVSLLFTGRPSNAAATVALAPHPHKAVRRIRE